MRRFVAATLLHVWCWVGAWPRSSRPSDLWETDAQHIFFEATRKNVSAIYMAQVCCAVRMKDFFPRVWLTQVSYSVLQLHYTLYCMYCMYICARPFCAQKKFGACVPGTRWELKEFIIYLQQQKFRYSTALFFCLFPLPPPRSLWLAKFSVGENNVYHK